MAVERAKHRLVQRDRDLAALASGKTRRLAKMKAKLKGEEESEDEYADDDFEMPAGFEDAFGGSAARPGTTKPKKRQDFGLPGTTVGRGRAQRVTTGPGTRCRYSILSVRIRDGQFAIARSASCSKYACAENTAGVEVAQ